MNTKTTIALAVALSFVTRLFSAEKMETIPIIRPAQHQSVF